MSSMKNRARILIVVFTFVLVSMGAHFGTPSEAAGEPQKFTDHPDTMSPFSQHQKHMKMQFSSGNLFKKLRSKLGAQNLNDQLANEQNNKMIKSSRNQIEGIKEKSSLGQILIKGYQKGVLIINQTTVMTAYASSQNKTYIINLNFINKVTKTNSSKAFKNYRMQHTGQLFFQLADRNTLILYAYEYFVVINLSDLSIRQQMKIPDVTAGRYCLYEEIYFIDTLVKNQSGKISKTLLLSSELSYAHLLRFNDATNLYEYTTEIYKPADALFLTGPNEGVSFWNYYRVPFNLTDQFRIVQRYQMTSSMYIVITLASNSEEMAVTATNYNQRQGIIYFSILDKESYYLRDSFSIKFPENFAVDGRKIRFTNDDKFLFFNMNNDQRSYLAVGVINVETGKATYFDLDGEKMTDFVCFDYGILSDTQFVIICQSLAKTKLPSTQDFYQLCLYNMSNFKLLDTYSVLTNATEVQIKTNPNFNSAFILQTFDDQNKPSLRMFQVVNNKITSGVIPSNFTNFRIASDCLNYIIGVFGDEPYHSFVNIKNFAVVKKTPIYDIGSFYDPYHQSQDIKYYMVQNNMVAICNRKKLYSTDCEMYEFYDLSKLGMPGDADFLCYFFLDYSSYIRFFLPKAKFVFQSQFYKNQFHGYDLQKCPTKKLIPLPIKHETQNQILTVLYKRRDPMQSIDLKPSQQQACNLVYLSANPNQIYVFQDCQPYKIVSVTTIPTWLVEGYSGMVESIYFSSNYKYLILSLRFTNRDNIFQQLLQLEVRALNDLNKSLHKTTLLKSIAGTPDVTDNDELVYTADEGVYLEKLSLKGAVLNRELIE